MKSIPHCSSTQEKSVGKKGQSYRSPNEGKRGEMVKLRATSARVRGASVGRSELACRAPAPEGGARSVYELCPFFDSPEFPHILIFDPISSYFPPQNIFAL